MGRREATKGKEARGSEREGEEADVEIVEVGESRKKEKEKDRRRSKLFRESTATLWDVRSLDMLLKFKPLPNHRVFLDVPDDVEVHEFVSISRYADYKGYTIVNERKMMKLMLQRARNMLVHKVGWGEGEEAAWGARPRSEEGSPQTSHSTGCSSTGGAWEHC